MFIDMYGRFQALKRKNPNLKTLLAVGGATDGNEGFKAVSRDSGKRAEFARNVVRYLKRFGFDGFDVDWEFPKRDERDDFTNLIKVVKH